MSEPNRNEQALWKSALGRSAACPDAETLDAAERNPAVQQHLASCSRCRAELAMLREFEIAEPQAHELAPLQWMEAELRRRAPELREASFAPREPAKVSTWARFRLAAAGLLSGPQRLRALGVAALSLLLVVGAGVYLRNGREAPPLAPAGAPVWRSGQFAAIAPAGDITQLPAEFRWETVAGATAYHLQVMEVDGSVIWSGDSSQVSMEIPPSVRRVMKPGRAFEWQVTAENAAREKIASTDLQIFHILATAR